MEDPRWSWSMPSRRRPSDPGWRKLSPSMTRRHELSASPAPRAPKPTRRHSWLILDRIVHRSRRPYYDSTTSETSYDCVGRPIRASLRVADSPAVSRLYLHWDYRRRLRGMEEPYVIAAHRHSILFRVVVPFKTNDWNYMPVIFPMDFFVYSASSSSSPSLTRLPVYLEAVSRNPKEDKYYQPYRRQRQRFMSEDEMGLLCHGEDGEFTVADLSGRSCEELELCMLHHAPNGTGIGMEWKVEPYVIATHHEWTKVTHTMLDDELSEECPLPVEWLPRFVGVATEQLFLRHDFRATCVMELAHGVHGYHKLSNSIHLLPGICRACVIPSGKCPATHMAHLPLLWQQKCVPLPKPFSIHLDELAEMVSDHQFPISPLTAEVTRDSSRYTGSQQVDACSEKKVERLQGNECSMSNTDSQKDGDSTDNNSLLIPIFVRHVSGELVFNVDLGQSSQHLMHLYAKRTKTKLECQYFIYRRQRLEPDCTLLFYGVQRDTTVHVCTGLLGGESTTLAQYVNDNGDKFTVEVTLPNGNISLQMTQEGCRFLLSWMKCFTTAFTKGQSWNGEFTMEDFKFIEGHVRYSKKPKGGYGPISMAKDLSMFVFLVEEILCSGKKNLSSKYPPYLKQFTIFLGRLFLFATSGFSDTEKLFLETHVCCMTSFAREKLIIELCRLYDALDQHDASIWNTAIEKSFCPHDWYSYLSKELVFKDIIQEVENDGRSYAKSNIGAFRLMKDMVLHATDYRGEAKQKFQNDGGIELMIPGYFDEFLPTIIMNLIKNNVDIRAKLLEAIQCACAICDSSH